MNSGLTFFFGISVGFLLWKMNFSSRISHGNVGNNITSGHIKSSQHKYQSVLLVLYYDQDMVQTLMNDEIITRVMRGISKQIRVVVCHASNTTPKEMILSYISELYARLWDAMLANNVVNIDCCVTSSLSGITTDDDFILNPSLEVVYTFNISIIDELQRIRKRSGLSEVVAVDTNAFHTSLTVHRTDSNVIFLDAPFDRSRATLNEYGVVAVGGTFDKLHNGHRKLLTLSAAVCTKKLVVGVSGAALLGHKSNAAAIASFDERVHSVTSFLSDVLGTRSKSVTVDIVELIDGYGPTVTDPSIDAIVVSSETLSGAFKINEVRFDRGMNVLAILVTRRSDAATLSSTYLRQLA